MIDPDYSFLTEWRRGELVTYPSTITKKHLWAFRDNYVYPPHETRWWPTRGVIFKIYAEDIFNGTYYEDTNNEYGWLDKLCRRKFWRGRTSEWSLPYQRLNGYGDFPSPFSWRAKGGGSAFFEAKWENGEKVVVACTGNYKEDFEMYYEEYNYDTDAYETRYTKESIEYNIVNGEWKFTASPPDGRYSGGFTEAALPMVPVLNDPFMSNFWTPSGEVVNQYKSPVTFDTLKMEALDRLAAKEDYTTSIWRESLTLESGKVYRISDFLLTAAWPHAWDQQFGDGIKFEWRLRILRTNGKCGTAQTGDAPKEYSWWKGDEEGDLVSPLISVSTGETSASHDITSTDFPTPQDLVPAHSLQSTTIFITGPKRKLRPSLSYDTIFKRYKIDATQAYDGSNRWFKTETISGDLGTFSSVGDIGPLTSPLARKFRDLALKYASPLFTGLGQWQTAPLLQPLLWKFLAIWNTGWGEQQTTTPRKILSPTQHIIHEDDIEIIFTLSDELGPNEVMDAEIPHYVGMLRTPYSLKKNIASCVISKARTSAVIISSTYTVTVSRPTLPHDGAGTVTAKWKIHTLNTATAEDHSESYTWPAREDEDPATPEPDTKTFGPYEVTAAEGEVKWIEVLEPEEAQHVWPSPIWYVAPKEN